MGKKKYLKAKDARRKANKALKGNWKQTKAERKRVLAKKHLSQ